LNTDNDQNVPQQSTIHIVDDDQTLHNALRKVLRSKGFAVNSYLSAEEFLNQLPDDPAGCIILDLQMPGMSGIELQQELERIGFSMPIIFLSGKATIEIAVNAVKNGAHDFLQKPASVSALHTKILLALDNNEQITQHNRLLARLTPREIQVLEMVVAGKTNRESSTQLGISQSTVEYHRSNMMKKLNARCLADLIKIQKEL